ncbi:MOSC domain-containing protein [Paenibacillus oenotherae]|uniref:MOSC domain-containing protein n=1 Tax=Paenibacillus oenotherae TaxID=1435645 RepID=A0ABS7DC65_9BACL|nr:MOSC domain-containing protein [Paenibacillus oenotherae]MBW7477528.1 MOSC domain-containing protein [Paenibacillus oenotherae]
MEEFGVTLLGKINSLNVSLPVAVLHGTKEIETGIFKKSAGQPLMLTFTGLIGDGQADLINHGGPDKAVCVYSARHYPYWSAKWQREVEPGAFGENFTVSDLTEETLCIGDIVRAGHAWVQVSQPRQPCFKLGMKHNLPELPQQVQQNGYTGFYFRVLQEGVVAAGDPLYLESRHAAGVTIAAANHVMYEQKTSIDSMQRLLAIPELAESWRHTFQSRIARLAADE